MRKSSINWDHGGFFIAILCYIKYSDKLPEGRVTGSKPKAPSQLGRDFCHKTHPIGNAPVACVCCAGNRFSRTACISTWGHAVLQNSLGVKHETYIIHFSALEWTWSESAETEGEKRKPWSWSHA